MATTQERALHDATPTCSMYAGAEVIVPRAADKAYTRPDDLRLARAPTQEREVGLGRAHCAKSCADSACLNTTIATLTRPINLVSRPCRSRTSFPVVASSAQQACLSADFSAAGPYLRISPMLDTNTTTTFRAGMALEEYPSTAHVRLIRTPAAFDPACSVARGQAGARKRVISCAR